MPSKLDILKHWYAKYYYLDSESPSCFVCNVEENLERAHLIPKSLGGTNDVDNLVLLCRKCHANAPNIAISKEFMLDWIGKESEKYLKIVGFGRITKDDFAKLSGDMAIIVKRLMAIYSNNDATDIIKNFLMFKFENDTLVVTAHNNADVNTKIYYFNYLSKYANLEEEFKIYLKDKIGFEYVKELNNKDNI